MLILKCASKFRPGGIWSDDDYDVFDGDRRVDHVDPCSAPGFLRWPEGAVV
jgi:hypothetical protein